MAIFKKLKKNFWILVLILVFISYGQTLQMSVWRDANAIFFKFTHLNEAAGYLGRGLFGEGTYKFSVTPYWFIYKLFGYENIMPYYLLNLIFYGLAALSVYYLFSNIFSKKSVKIAGFLFACGYIACEGFFSLDSSMILNVSIILTSLSVVFYKKKYLLALIFYFLAVYITPVRTHYVILVITLFDILFRVKKINIKNCLLFLIRMVPFWLIFYFNFVKGADQRTFQISSFLKEIFSGKIYNLYSTFGTLGYLFVPDRQIHVLASLPVIKIIAFSIFAIFVFLASKNKKNKIIPILFFTVSSFVWFFLARQIYSATQINFSREGSLAVFLGGLIIIFFATIFLISVKKRIELIFMFFWLITSLIAYTSYEPTTIYSTVERYLAHSFIAVVGILSLVGLGKSKKVFIYLVLAWGALNLSNSLFYENNVLQTRSFPTKKFYEDLKSYVPVIKKGDVLYFDVKSDAQSYFASAFSVGQMPDETAIAWRWAIDRYDIVRLTDFDELVKFAKSKKTNNIYTFFYNKDGLINTTKLSKRILDKGLEKKNVEFKVENDVINLQRQVDSITPTLWEFKLTPSLPLLTDIEFPLVKNENMKYNSTAIDSNLRDLAFEYQKEKQQILKNITLSPSSEWRENVVTYAVDQDVNTAWRPDRVEWAKGKDYLILNLNASYEIDRFVWKNAYSNNTPVEYGLDVSNDGINWNEVAKINEVKRIESEDIQIISFKPQNIKFLRFRLIKSLSGDSPGISEVWVVPSKFHELDIKDTEEFLTNPLGFVNSSDDYVKTIRNLNFLGKIKISWLNDKSDSWQGSEKVEILAIFDGVERVYNAYLPAGGTKISKLKLENLQFPANLEINSIQVSSPNLNNLLIK